MLSADTNRETRKFSARRGSQHGFLRCQIWHLICRPSAFPHRVWIPGPRPKGVAKGDILCHLAAHSNPFLLRPAGPRYTNIGDCNVLDLDLPDVVEELTPHMRVFEIE